MAHKFTISAEALIRRFAVYVVIATNNENSLLYVGKTGDNREGCNPLISRCGNHFSYNKIHSQLRNKIEDHENRKYTYIFDHFDKYTEDESMRRISIDRINEMERWLNQETQKIISDYDYSSLLNPYSGVGVSNLKRKEREKLRNPEDHYKILGIIDSLRNHMNDLNYCISRH